MPLRLADRVQETTTSTGTGDLALAGAKPGYRTFASVLSVGDTFYYTITDATGNWEVGIGTYPSANTLRRTTVQASSNANGLVNFPAGTKDAFITAAAATISRIFSTTISPNANTPLTVLHNLALSNRDNFVIRVADSTGQQVGVRVVAVDVNNITITTANSAANLRVTIVGG